MPRGIFVAATGQNVGKTTVCLGLVSGLKKRYGSVGYLKPVGQEHVETETGVSVDKDVVLFKGRFALLDPYETMSPVLFPRGFTRDFLDGKIERKHLVGQIQDSYATLKKKHLATVVEGTGHTGVGSIVDLNNAQVASLLKTPVVLVAPGGLGSSFDELSLNYTQCEKQGAKIAGVILNRVLDSKREMIVEYMAKALKRWDLPILGCIPFDSFLSSPTMKDFEQLFQVELLSGEEHRLRHFEDIRLAATSAEMYRSLGTQKQLIIASADREDIILTALTRFWDSKIANPGVLLECGMILTGKTPPKGSIIEQIQRADLPMLYVPVSSFAAMKMITTYTTKIRREDTEKVEEAIGLVEAHIDYDLLIERTHQLE